jgi:hypothetical protein
VVDEDEFSTPVCSGGEKGIEPEWDREGEDEGRGFGSSWEEFWRGRMGTGWTICGALFAEKMARIVRFKLGEVLQLAGEAGTEGEGGVEIEGEDPEEEEWKGEWGRSGCSTSH